MIGVRRFVALGLLIVGQSALLRAQAWQVDPAFGPQLLNESSAPATVRVVPLQDGRLLVQGAFEFVNRTLASTGFARLRADGGLDAILAAGPPGFTTLHALAPLRDGKIIGIGYGYTSESTRSRVQTFRLLADGAVDSTFSALEIEVTGPTIRLIPLATGQILVAGGFGLVGHRRSQLARLHADGSLDLTFSADLGSPLFALTAVAPDALGRVVVAANVATSGQIGVPRLLRLNSNGTRDPTFAPVAPMRAIAVIATQPDGRVLVDGYDQPLNRLNADGSRDASFAWRVGNDSVQQAVVLSDGRIVASTSASTVLLLDRVGAVQLDARSLVGQDQNVSLVTVESGDDIILSQVARNAVLLGPAISTSATIPYPSITPGALSVEAFPLPGSTLRRLRADATLDATFAVRFATAGDVTQVRVDAAGRLLVLGNFDRINDESRAAGLVRLLPDGSIDRSFALQPPLPYSSQAQILPQPDGKVLLKYFTRASNIEGSLYYSAAICQRLNSDGSLDPSFALSAADANTQLFDVGSDGSIVGGLFVNSDPMDTFGGYRLVRFSPDGSRRESLLATYSVTNIGWFGVGPPSPVNAVRVLDDGRMMVAGIFTSVSGFARPGIARLNADGSLDQSYVPQTSDLWVNQPRPLNAIEPPRAYALLLDNGRALLSDHYEFNSRIIRLQPDGRADPSFSVRDGPGEPIVAEQPDGALVFSSARLLRDSSRDLNYAPVFNTSPAAVSTGAALANGSIYLGGSFASVNGLSRPGLARVVPVEAAGITLQPKGQTVIARSTVVFEVAQGQSAQAAFQWTRNGNPIAGATDATLTLDRALLADAGVYRVEVTVAGQTYLSDFATLVITPSPARLINLSARARLSPATGPLVCGFAVSTQRLFLLRALGPALAGLGVSDALPDTELTLRAVKDFSSIYRDRGSATQPTVAFYAQRVGAFPIVLLPNPSGPVVVSASGSTNDSGIVINLDRPAYTAAVTSPTGQSGIALFELYDAGPLTAPGALTNLSARAHTGTGTDTLTVGFVVDGNPLRLLVRGIGPTLAQFGVTDALAQLRLSLRRSDSDAVLATNDGWAGSADVATASQRVGAFPLPATSRDAAMILTLAPGAYTVQLAGANNTSGTGLIELYALGP